MRPIWPHEADYGSLDLGEDRAVSRLAFDFAVTITIGARIDIRLSTMTTLSRSNETTRVFDPESDAAEVAASLVELHQSELREAHVGLDQTLTLTFATGTVVKTLADPDYEAWQVSASTGERLIAVPGGPLAYWGPTDQAQHR